ncbi:MAG: hypothetical protein AB7K24_06955, partial [Gemmataceae bacterium]
MSDEIKVVDGPLNLEAWGAVSITSRGSGTCLRANGENSALSLDSQGTASMTAGSAGLILVNQGLANGLVNLFGGELGTILLSVGLPEIGPRIELTPESITLAVGPPGAGTSITLT